MRRKYMRVTLVKIYSYSLISKPSVRDTEICMCHSPQIDFGWGDSEN